MASPAMNNIERYTSGIPPPSIGVYHPTAGEQVPNEGPAEGAPRSSDLDVEKAVKNSRRCCNLHTIFSFIGNTILFLGTLVHLWLFTVLYNGLMRVVVEALRQLLFPTAAGVWIFKLQTLINGRTYSIFLCLYLFFPPKTADQISEDEQDVRSFFKAIRKTLTKGMFTKGQLWAYAFFWVLEVLVIVAKMAWYPEAK